MGNDSQLFFEEMKMRIVNVTPHSIRFRRQDGSEYEVLPSGVRLGAEFQEEVVGISMRGLVA